MGTRISIDSRECSTSLGNVVGATELVATTTVVDACVGTTGIDVGMEAAVVVETGTFSEVKRAVSLEEGMPDVTGFTTTAKLLRTVAVGRVVASTELGPGLPSRLGATDDALVVTRVIVGLITELVDLAASTLLTRLTWNFTDTEEGPAAGAEATLLAFTTALLPVTTDGENTCALPFTVWLICTMVELLVGVIPAVVVDSLIVVIT